MDELYLAHSGKGHDENPPGRGSGRYPWGSGNRKHQHDWDVKARMDKLAAQGMSQADIAKAMGYTKYDYYTKETKPSISKYKAERQIAVRNIRMDEFEEILWYDSHKDPETGKPYTNKKIAELMGLPNESSVRTKRNNAYEEDPIFKATDKLKQAVKENGYLDVGKGTELYVGLSPDSFKTSLEVLRNEGYEIFPLKQEQNNNPGGNKTTTMVLIAPNKVGENDKQTFKDAYEALKSGKISRLKDDDDVSNPLSQRVHQWEDPIKVPLKKIEIKYFTFSKEKEYALFKNTLMNLYKENRDGDMKRKATSIGIHHDDIKMYMDQKDVGVYASQGQNRICALSLKLSMFNVIKKYTNEDAIVILDDVLSELDEAHQIRLLAKLREFEQVFITCAKENFRVERCTTYVIKENKITRRM